MKRQFLSLFVLITMMMSLSAFQSPEPSAVAYQRVQRQKVSAKLVQNLRKSPRVQKAATIESGFLKAKAGFKLYNYNNVTILLKDPDNKFKSSLQGKDIKYFKFKFDIIIVPICVCNEGSDDCELIPNHQGDVECRGSICTDCLGGFDIFTGSDDIPQVISPW